MAGMVMATARVEGVAPPSRSPSTGDPLQYLTDIPALVLALKDITMVPRPVQFRDVIGQLSLKIHGKGNYGTLLQGGSRSLTRADWEVLVGRA